MTILAALNRRWLQEESSKITTQATGSTSWRRGDVKYKKNEAFVDVVETVNLSMSAKGDYFPPAFAWNAHSSLLQAPSCAPTSMATS